MDKSWATLNPFTEDYRTGLAKFISNSLEVSSHDGNIKCPCVKCLNMFWLINNEVEAHLIVEGMDRPLLEDIFSGPSGMAGMPINNHTGQEALILAYARKKWIPSYKYFKTSAYMGALKDVEHATGDNDEVRVSSDVDAQDFEECA
ncbi:unnamed protein product [Malus baccata var. baccata]